MRNEEGADEAIQKCGVHLSSREDIMRVIDTALEYGEIRHVVCASGVSPSLF